MGAPRYFEQVEGDSEKFWEVQIQNGSRVIVRFGRIGSAGQTREKAFESDDDASAEVQRLVAEKTQRGYVERALAVAPAPAPRRSAMAGATAPVTLPVDVKVRAAALRMPSGPRDLADGESIVVPGSGGASYVLKNVGGVYSCSCSAWRDQKAGAERRTCKHLRALRGDDAEAARIGGETVPVDVRAPRKP